jgi:hypothetical protein
VTGGPRRIRLRRTTGSRKVVVYQGMSKIFSCPWVASPGKVKFSMGSADRRTPIGQFSVVSA